MIRLTQEDLGRLVLEKTPLIDVRAPIEFAQGHIPGATNLPLLDDEQRARVGTIHKHEGTEAAVRLGHELIRGETREARLLAWGKFARENPQAWIYCFRGGMRSRLVCKDLADNGIKLPVLAGGYKRFRRFAIETLETLAPDFVVLSGLTGAGKTELLRANRAHLPVCDLEAAAHHRGSAFGARPEAQRSQINFEHEILLDLLRASSEKILVEDESRTIGKCAIPNSIFKRLATAPMIVLERPREERARFLIQTYLAENYEIHNGDVTFDLGLLRSEFHSRLKAMAKRLGGALFTALLTEVDAALEEQRRTGQTEAHLGWVTLLLEKYYDPMYRRHIDANADRVALRGDADEVNAYLQRMSCGNKTAFPRP